MKIENFLASKINIYCLVLFLTIFPQYLNAAEKRQEPVYSEVKNDSLTLKEIALWPLKVAFYPIYVVTDYGIRRPIGSLVKTAEKNKWYDHYVEFFTFGPDEDEIGVFPTFFYEFGFRPTVGIHAYRRNFPNEKHLPEFWAAWGGEDWTAFRLQDTYQIKKHNAKLIFSASKVDRPDLLFFGVGPKSVKSNESRYSLDSTEVSASLRKVILKSSKVNFGLGFINRKLSDGDCCSDPGINEKIGKGFFPSPSGLNDEYNMVTPSIILEFGNRLARPEEWYGGRAILFSKYNIRTDKSDADWTHYGGSLFGFKRLDNRHRMFVLGISASFIEQHGQGAVPFHELAGNGQKVSLLGFKERRVIGDSIIVGSFEYKWPVWVYLDGVLHYSVGNAFDSNLNGFEFGRLRQSIALGLRKTASFGPYFNLLFGLGSKSFDEGGDFNEVRIVIGAGRAF